ncbi:sugar phosphate nucleotidyltransferase [Saccharopolyspora thermophila]|uniref:UTP--glucose-1-phosphate uridylyltransferase n=1 Tax=Saccharopolyspora thermophila TaxID=89367 RepID=A0ABN1D6U3_9PSEU
MISSSFPAVVTAAGAATRFRPFSRCVPKEMLPVGSIPAVEHVIAECLAAGASEVVVVTRPGDSTIPEHVGQLRSEGAPVETIEEDLDHGYGNAAPLLSLRHRLTNCDAFAVAFGDDLLLGEPTPGYNLATMRQRSVDAEAMIAGQMIPVGAVESFGIIDTEPQQPNRVRSIRQRPHPGEVGEPLAVVSRLILRPSIFDHLAASEQARGEVDLGIAVGNLASVARVAVHRITGSWVTVGDPLHYLDALKTYWQLDPAQPTYREGQS